MGVGGELNGAGEMQELGERETGKTSKMGRHTMQGNGR